MKTFFSGVLPALSCLVGCSGLRERPAGAGCTAARAVYATGCARSVFQHLVGCRPADRRRDPPLDRRAAGAERHSPRRRKELPLPGKCGLGHSGSGGDTTEGHSHPHHGDDGEPGDRADADFSDAGLSGRSEGDGAPGDLSDLGREGEGRQAARGFALSGRRGDTRDEQCRRAGGVVEGGDRGAAPAARGYDQATGAGAVWRQRADQLGILHPRLPRGRRRAGAGGWKRELSQDLRSERLDSGAGRSGPAARSDEPLPAGADAERGIEAGNGGRGDGFAACAAGL